MTIQVPTIIKDASTALGDPDHVRWKLIDLLSYMNAAAREIALHKPNATSETKYIALTTGTQQQLADGDVQLIRVIRNVSGAVDAEVDGRAVTPVNRTLMDQQIPSWSDPNVLPYSAEVIHVIDDISDTDVFYVVPGNDGTGKLEVVMSVIPADAELEAGDDGSDEDHFSDLAIGVKSIYRNALLDYVLYRCYARDQNVPASAQLANSHYQMFANALGLKLQGEAVANVNTTNATS